MKNSAPFQWMISFLLAVIYFAIRFTCRVQYVNREARDAVLKSEGQAIFTLWHGRLYMMPLLFPLRLKVHALISAHADGRIIKNTAAFFCIGAVTGSSSKGGAAALREMVTLFKKKKRSIFITPDGPKGPRMNAQMGAIELARLTGGTLIPCSISASNGKIIRSWDRFLIPRPFSTIYIAFASGIRVSSKDEREQKLKEVETTMNALQQKLDAQTSLIEVTKGEKA